MVFFVIIKISRASMWFFQPCFFLWYVYNVVMLVNQAHFSPTFSLFKINMLAVVRACRYSVPITEIHAIYSVFFYCSSCVRIITSKACSSYPCL